MTWLKKRWWLIIVVLAFLVVAPLPAAAMTNGEVIAILTAGLASWLQGMGVLRDMVRDAYCAGGIVALCP